jgi:hypothetical protein
VEIEVWKKESWQVNLTIVNEMFSKYAFASHPSFLKKGVPPVRNPAKNYR